MNTMTQKLRVVYYIRATVVLSWKKRRVLLFNVSNLSKISWSNISVQLKPMEYTRVQKCKIYHL